MKLNEIYNEDCLEGMKRIPDGSVDCIVCDLPYGTTDCAWDSVIPFDKLWAQYHRVLKTGGGSSFVRKRTIQYVYPHKQHERMAI